MNKLLFSKNFYLFLWKKDRALFLWMLAKCIIFSIIMIVIVLSIISIYINEKRNLSLEQKKFIIIQKKILEVKNKQTLYENNRNNIDEMKKNNFFAENTDSVIFNAFKKITNDVNYPTSEYFNIELKNVIATFSERKKLFNARMSFQGKFWHENDFFEFLEKINVLHKTIREEECILYRNGKKGDYTTSKVLVEKPEPSLEVKCTIGLYWVH